MTPQGDGLAAVPHQGPISQGCPVECPVECLQAVMSRGAYLGLTFAPGARFPPPRTVGDVIGLYARRELRGIRGLGPRRLSEIEAVLVLAGVDLSAPQLTPGQTGAEPHASSTRATPPARLAGCPLPAVKFRPLLPAAQRRAWLLACIAAHCLRRDVTVAEVADAAGLSVRRLQAVCKRDFGRSPVRLLADMRLHRVHLALTGQGPAPASIVEAAALAGHSLPAFRTAYRARYGRYPSLPAQLIAKGERSSNSTSDPH